METGVLYALMGVSQIGSGYANAAAMRAQGEYQATMLTINSRIADMQGDDAIYRGEKEAEKYQKNLAQLKGSQVVAAASQGIDVGSGSAAEIREETARTGAADVVQIRANAWKEAWGYKVQAQGYRGQATMSQIGANFGANQSILSGYASASQNFLRASDSFSKVSSDKSKQSWAPSSPSTSLTQPEIGSSYRQQQVRSGYAREFTLGADIGGGSSKKYSPIWAW